ncbi:MAG: riboflavin biosynthesis protein RibF [Coriobacteriales bacterium]|jgi:riboflavin kinase/FMN adenylyltransferase|nr:riboflavin biosynthesis protein RibF [Coriobacteriales bacterium]
MEYLDKRELTDAWLTAAQRARIVDLKADVPFGEPCVIDEAVCAMGVFDGVHEGHRYIIGTAVKQAASLGLPVAVITFDHDPDELFLPLERQRKLMTNEDRLAHLATLEVAHVLVIPFDEALAARSPRDFLDGVIAAQGTPRAIHVGRDFHFGSRALGTVDDLRQWGSKRGCEVVGHDLLTTDGAAVRATRIRDALAAGHLEEANNLLRRPFYLRGRVVPGRYVGRELGFPTANIVPEAGLAPLGDGVYGGYVLVDDLPYKAAISVGVPVTFSETNATIEAHLLDFTGDLYGAHVKLAFVEYLRPMRAFESVEELVRTVNANIAWVQENL